MKSSEFYGVIKNKIFYKSYGFRVKISLQRVLEGDKDAFSCLSGASSSPIIAWNHVRGSNHLVNS